MLQLLCVLLWCKTSRYFTGVHSCLLLLVCFVYMHQQPHPVILDEPVFTHVCYICYLGVLEKEIINSFPENFILLNYKINQSKQKTEVSFLVTNVLIFSQSSTSQLPRGYLVFIGLFENEAVFFFIELVIYKRICNALSNDFQSNDPKWDIRDILLWCNYTIVL